MAAGRAGDWLRPTHAALSRISLAMCGWLTLTWLHRWPAGRRWWLLAALPLAEYALFVAGALSKPQTAVASWIMWNVATYGFMLQAVAVLLVFVDRRDSLMRLIMQLELLEKKWADGGFFRSKLLLLQFLLIWALSFYFFISCLVVFADALSHGNFVMLPVWAPAPLLTSVGRWFLLGFQVLLVLSSCCLGSTFDSCYFVWMKAAGFHLREIRRRLDSAHLSEQDLDMDLEHDLETNLETDLETNLETGLEQKPERDLERAPERGTGRRRAAAVAPADAAAAWSTSSNSTVEKKPAQGTAGRQMTASLLSASLYYDDVTRLVNTINEVTGAASVVMYATTITATLMDSYLLMTMIFQPAAGDRSITVISLASELILFGIRLVVYSLSGDEIIQESSALFRRLVGLSSWRLTERERQQREQLLLKTQRPLCVEPLGFFAVRKSSLLSILGLVVTYFVIIVQMVESH